MTPASATNSESLWISTASTRLAVAATKASAKETLCAAFNFAASPHKALSDWCHRTGLSSTDSRSSRALSTPSFCVVMYSNSVSETKEECSVASPSIASSKYVSTSSAPGSSCDQVSQAEVSRRTSLLTSALRRPVSEQGFQQTAAGKQTAPAPDGFSWRRVLLVVRHAGLLQLPQHFTLLLRRQRLDLFQNRLGFRAYALNFTRSALKRQAPDLLEFAYRDVSIMRAASLFVPGSVRQTSFARLDVNTMLRGESGVANRRISDLIPACQCSNKSKNK